MYVLERTQDLVEEVLRVLVREGLSGVDDTVQICLHQLRNYVNVLDQKSQYQTKKEKEKGTTHQGKARQGKKEGKGK